MRLGIFLVLSIATLNGVTFAQHSEHSPQLLLTPQRLKRLKRDHDRQTPRWINFEERVKNVPDSPERGFELALYYAVTGDEARGREAVNWAQRPGSEPRQVGLILDWCRDLISDEERRILAKCVIFITPNLPPFVPQNGCLFKEIAGGSSAPMFSDPKIWKTQIDWLVGGGFQQTESLYAAIETIMVLRTTQHIDLREDFRQFFNSLPIQFLLSLKPDQAEHPDWLTHIAALALVNLDPNSDSSQFLQGWAIEDRQMVREGPGVAYELLWADPYLPGVGYQNLDPWWYDEASGRLLARTNWEPDACWIQITTKGVEQQSCPANWQTQTVNFGRLQLTPVTQNCVEVQRAASNSTTFLWKLKPNQKLKYTEEKKSMTVEADGAGLWRVPVNIEGKVCAVR